MVRILSVGALKSLVRQDNEALRKAGFTISVCHGPVRAKRLLGRPDRYDMLLIGHSVAPKHRDWLLEYVKQTSPETRVRSFSLDTSVDTIATDVVCANGTSEGMVTTVRRLAEEVLADSVAISVPVLAPKDTRILYVAPTEALALMRRDQLKEAGYNVQAAATAQEVEIACEQQVFHLAIISPAIGPRVKLKIAGAVRQGCPAARILETGTPIPVIEGANSSMGVSGQDLIKAIAYILGQRPIEPRYSQRQLSN